MNTPHSAPYSSLSEGPGRGFGGLCADFLREYFEKIAHSIESLREAEIWWRPGEEVNSIGNLLLHLNGNLRQWVVDTLGGESFERRRSEEFHARESSSKTQMLADLRTTVDRCRAIAQSMSDRALLERRQVQGYEVDGTLALFHVTEHMAYHTGQVVLLAKQRLEGRDRLEFYPRLRE